MVWSWFNLLCKMKLWFLNWFDMTREDRNVNMFIYIYDATVCLFLRFKRFKELILMLQNLKLFIEHETAIKIYFMKGQTHSFHCALLSTLLLQFSRACTPHMKTMRFIDVSKDFQFEIKRLKFFWGGWTEDKYDLSFMYKQ